MKQAKTFRMVRAQRLGRRRSNFQGCEPELWETVAVTRGIQGLAKRRTQSRIPHYIVVMSPLASVDCGSFAEFLCFDDLDGIEEYRSGIFLM
uniref:Uncharacterized protein LOC112827149 isoform X4 n=1 Tax=Callorhinus ursinus TaxID=34884 RepID=A0A3Q7PD16_CALUR|nr:uncharacterized protein LOC112827149 isoform X4 [Callorhinus ursinus]